MRDRNASLSAKLASAMLTWAACSDDRAGADAGSSGAESSGTDTSSSTGEPDGCGRVHEGNLYVLEDTDLASLSDVGHVTGYVQISMGAREQVDLSFLGCLEKADFGLILEQNGALETTEGLSRLAELSNLRAYGNVRLRAITGFDHIKEIGAVDISLNPALEEVHLESVESISRLTVGYCMGAGIDLSGNASLVDIDGFANLTHIGDLNIRGNEGLMSAQVLDVLMANGAGPLEDVEVMWNANLPEQEVNAKLDALGVTGVRTVCGNAEGVQDQCDCGIE